MASSALDILKGIGAAAAGLAGEKVSKSGSIPGLDIAAILPALLGKAGGAGDILGKVASVASIASKAGLLKDSKLGNIAELAGSLLSTGKTSAAKTESAAKEGGIAGLAAAIMGSSGTGAGLASIASLASKLGKTAEDDKGLKGMASELGKTLSGTFGVSLGGSATAVKALDKVLEKDTKTDLFKSILTGLLK
ncbi:MAG: hypothetical protein LBG94_08390 [Treponema sp.]|jgi:hypothetical protein|nr:hypothetical protein [Treponema sp.]